MVDPQANKNMDNNNSNKDREETVAERSARLEAEAQALYQKQAHGIDAEDSAHDEPSAEAARPAATESASASTESNASMFEAQIEALKAEVAATKDQMMRVAADAENTKRRALKDRDDAGKFAIQSFSRDLINVADNLRRALDAVPDDLKEDARISNLTDGIEATERELLRSFEKNGIAKINPKGEIFDPNFHEVMFEAPMPTQPAGTIIEVIETGYTLHGRLLRPARVGVVKDDGQGNGKPTDPGSTIDTQA